MKLVGELSLWATAVAGTVREYRRRRELLARRSDEEIRAAARAEALRKSRQRTKVARRKTATMIGGIVLASTVPAWAIVSAITAPPVHNGHFSSADAEKADPSTSPAGGSATRPAAGPASPQLPALVGGQVQADGAAGEAGDAPADRRDPAAVEVRADGPVFHESSTPALPAASEGAKPSGGAKPPKQTKPTQPKPKPGTGPTTPGGSNQTPDDPAQLPGGGTTPGGSVPDDPQPNDPTPPGDDPAQLPPGDPGSGDPGSGDPGSDRGPGDPGAGDPGAGEPGSGDPAQPPGGQPDPPADTSPDPRPTEASLPGGATGTGDPGSGDTGTSGGAEPSDSTAGQPSPAADPAKPPAGERAAKHARSAPAAEAGPSGPAEQDGPAAPAARYASTYATGWTTAA